LFEQGQLLHDNISAVCDDIVIMGNA